VVERTEENGGVRGTMAQTKLVVGLTTDPRTASTWKVWVPRSRPRKVTPPVAQLVSVTESREHLKSTPGSESTYRNVAEVELVGFDGLRVMIGADSPDEIRPVCKK